MSTRIGRWLLNAALYPFWCAGALVGAYARLATLIAQAVRLGFVTGYGENPDEPA
jgi:hypothetical protein